MIAHLVLMDLKQPADAPFVTEQVHSLAGKVPGLLSAQGGASVVQLQSTWSLGFMMVFSNEKSVHSYQTHPAHVDVASNIRGLVREMATCDLSSDVFTSLVGAS